MFQTYLNLQLYYNLLSIIIYQTMFKGPLKKFNLMTHCFDKIH